MAQTGFTPISLYYSSTATNVPTNTNLAAGELAINTADGKLFFKDSSGVVQVLATKGGVGSSTTTQVLYNTSGLVVGSANLTFNGTTLTTVNDASISGLTVGKGGGAIATNTVVGASSGNANTTGAANSFFGQSVGTANTTGSANAIFGSNYVGFSVATFSNNTTGSYNTAVGVASMAYNTTASNNSAFGYASLYANTTGAYNTAIGQQALQSNTTASNNTAVGYQAGNSNTTSTDNVFVGYQAGYSTSTGTGRSVAIGKSALYSATTATDNTAVGYFAANGMTTGIGNAAFGGGIYGIANSTLQTNSTGSYNSAFGAGALSSNTTASYNTAVGYQALYSNTGNSYSTAIGSNAGYSSTGSGNTFIGYSAGQYNTPTTTGINNIYLGNSCFGSSGSAQQELVIGYAVGGKGNNTGYMGFAMYQGNNSTLWSITSDQRLKKNIVDNTVGLDAITKIQVRNFEYRLPEEITELDKSCAINIKGIQLGPIAQELAQVLPDCVKTESTGVMSVDASNITWHLINAVKELNAKVTALEAQLGK